MVKSQKELTEVLFEALNEFRREFDFYSKGFDDIKTKAQIYLIVISLFLTLPLTSNSLLKIISSSCILNSLYFIGIIVSLVAIILLMTIIQSSNVSLVNAKDLLENIKNLSIEKTLSAFNENYEECNDEIKKVYEKKSKLLQFVGYLILVEISTISISLLFLIVNLKGSI